MIISSNYHKFGDYHYNTIFSKLSKGFIIDEKNGYLTEDSFFSLIIDVHEQYHIMQDLLQGYCLWYWYQRGNIAHNVAQSINNRKISKKEIPLSRIPFSNTHEIDLDPLDYIGEADKSQYSQVLCWNMTYFSHWIKDILDNWKESWGIDWIHPFCYELTSLDIIECHAAILTDLFLSKTISESPQLFSKDIIEDLSSSFQLEKMPENYLKPLIALNHMYRDFSIEKHYPFLENRRFGHLYDHALFFLDFALHTIPDPLWGLGMNNDSITVEDLLPTTRFLKLAYYWMYKVKKNEFDYQDKLIDDKIGYNEKSKILSELINNDNHKIRKDNGIEQNFGLKLFRPINEVSNLWIETLEKSKRNWGFRNLLQKRINALNNRNSNEHIYLTKSPLHFFKDIQLPLFYISNSNFLCYRYYNPKKIIDYFYETDKNKNLPDTMIPEKFFEDYTNYEIFCNIGIYLLVQQEFNCSYLNYPHNLPECELVNENCNKLINILFLNKKKCKLQKCLEKFFGTINYT